MFALLCSAGCQSASAHGETVVRAGESAGPKAALTGLLDLRNRPVDPLRASSAKAIVLIFVRTDCPISNRYAPEIERLYQKYATRRVAFWLVYPDPDTLPEEIASHIRAYGLSLGALRDPQHVWVKRAGVRVTPEVAVWSADGRELYRGRLDNRYSDYGKERPAPTRRDLDDALAAILNGKPIASAVTIAIGCYIPELP